MDECKELLSLFIHADSPMISVARKSLWGSFMTISFNHPVSYPGSDSSFRQELKYEIVSRNGVGSCPSTSSSIEVHKSLATSFKVKVSYGDGIFKDLGQIYSEQSKSYNAINIDRPVDELQWVTSV